MRVLYMVCVCVCVYVCVRVCVCMCVFVFVFVFVCACVQLVLCKGTGSVQASACCASREWQPKAATTMARSAATRPVGCMPVARRESFKEAWYARRVGSSSLTSTGRSGGGDACCAGVSGLFDGRSQ